MPGLLTGWLLILACGGCGSGPKLASPRDDAAALEKAFQLSAAANPSSGPAALAARAVAAIRAEDWVTAVPLLHQLRTTAGLTAEQFEAVHNANGNAYVRLVEMADRGSAEARGVLDRLKKQQDRR